MSSTGHVYILTATDYFTKWVEAIPTKKANAQVTCEFLMNHIIVRFGIPMKIVSDNASYFSSEEISMFCYDHGITLAHASDYFPQGNGQAESSNKNLISIMKKLVSDNGKDWHKKLFEALWADRTSPKRAIGMSPFELVYGIGAQISLPLDLAA
jgi:transposase InsO family protein